MDTQKHIPSSRAPVGAKNANSKQALRNSCELLRQIKELHTSSWNCIQAHGTACKNLGTAWKLIEMPTIE